jgi:hypothetical protein
MITVTHHSFLLIDYFARETHTNLLCKENERNSLEKRRTVSGTTFQMMEGSRLIAVDTLERCNILKKGVTLWKQKATS